MMLNVPGALLALVVMVVIGLIIVELKGTGGGPVSRL